MIESSYQTNPSQKKTGKITNFLIHAVGSYGDILPLIAIGRELQARGHSVHFFVDPYFIKHVQNAGLASTPVTNGLWNKLLKSQNTYHPTKIHDLLAHNLAVYVESALQAMKPHIDNPQTTVTVGNTYSGRLMRDLHGCPTVSVYYAPYSIRSSIRPPRYLSRAIKLPAAANKMFFWLMDVFFIDRVYGRPLNALRKRLGLKPVKRICNKWMYSADVQLGLFPTWFAQTQPDWPPHFQKTGFPLFDSGDGILPEKVKTFLDSGEKPIAFTAGSFNTSSDDFFDVSVKACRKIGKRAMLISPSQENISQSLPAGIAHFSYVPFGALMPHLAAFVHHGGIGSLAQTMAAGIPQLIRPMFGDQFDSAQRITELGIAREVLPKDYTPDNVAKALTELVDNPIYKQNSMRYAAMLAKENGVSNACDAILKYFGAL
jgi:UDP:flavonoid glycosyltransferase YjiC (YdhE family)